MPVLLYVQSKKSIRKFGKEMFFRTIRDENMGIVSAYLIVQNTHIDIGQHLSLSRLS